jgi:hypothetical protein
VYGTWRPPGTRESYIVHPDRSFPMAHKHADHRLQNSLLCALRCIDLCWLRRHARSVWGVREGGPLPNHQDRSSEAERWPKRQGESDPESEFEWKKCDREHRSGTPTTPQKPSRQDLQPTDAQERHEQRNGSSYANSLEWPPTVRRKPEEGPDLTGPREIPDPVGTRQTETEPQNDAEDRGKPHHRLGCSVRSTRLL